LYIPSSLSSFHSRSPLLFFVFPHSLLFKFPHPCHLFTLPHPCLLFPTHLSNFNI
jgi:hypothetical protein